MSSTTDITGIIIAGGKSSRMGQNKALINYNGKRLIDNAIQILQPLVKSIIVSSNVIIEQLSNTVIADEIENIGPMGGLYTCIKASNTQYNLVLPCDVPNVEPNVLIEIIEQMDGYDAVIPRLPNGKYEPLVACYSKSILALVEKAISSGNYKLIHLIEQANVKYIKISNVAQFKNLNTPNDLL